VITSSDSQAPADSKCRAGRTPLSVGAEVAERIASPDTLREDEDATPVEPPASRGDSLAASSPSLDAEPSSLQVTQNDIVVLAGERGTWQVVAPVNGSKADIRRREGFDTRVVTAVLKNLTIVRCAGSPECNY
jgi:hypothetical protein